VESRECLACWFCDDCLDENWRLLSSRWKNWRGRLRFWGPITRVFIQFELKDGRKIEINWRSFDLSCWNLLVKIAIMKINWGGIEGAGGNWSLEIRKPIEILRLFLGLILQSLVS
jgi:hypothetical protein